MSTSTLTLAEMLEAIRVELGELIDDPHDGRLICSAVELIERDGPVDLSTVARAVFLANEAARLSGPGPWSWWRR